MFSFLVSELNEYCWLTKEYSHPHRGRSSSQTTNNSSDELEESTTDRLEYLVLLLECFKAVFGCQPPQRATFMKPKSRITLLAEFVWLLAAAGQPKSAETLDEMYGLQNDDFSDASTMLSVRTGLSVHRDADKGLEAMLERKQRDDAECEEIISGLSLPKEQQRMSRSGLPTIKLDPRVGYVKDLVATLLCEVEALVQQSRATGGLLQRSMFCRAHVHCAGLHKYAITCYVVHRYAIQHFSRMELPSKQHSPATC